MAPGGDVGELISFYHYYTITDTDFIQKDMIELCPWMCTTLSELRSHPLGWGYQDIRKVGGGGGDSGKVGSESHFL